LKELNAIELEVKGTDAKILHEMFKKKLTFKNSEFISWVKTVSMAHIYGQETLVRKIGAATLTTAYGIVFDAMVSSSLTGISIDDFKEKFHKFTLQTLAFQVENGEYQKFIEYMDKHQDKFPNPFKRKSKVNERKRISEGIDILISSTDFKDLDGLTSINFPGLVETSGDVPATLQIHVCQELYQLI